MREKKININSYLDPWVLPLRDPRCPHHLSRAVRTAAGKATILAEYRRGKAELRARRRHQERAAVLLAFCPRLLAQLNFPDSPGTLVIAAGREFFVGISKWTNHKGAEYVADAFKDFTVSIVHIPEPHHLKSFCSMGGPSTIVIGSSEVARKAIKAMEELTDYQYHKLSVPDDAAANCIYARVGNKSNTLVHRTAEEFSESSKAFKKLPDYTLIPASCTEVAKLGAALSSCSILINKKF
uniref:N(G),N(G)-dimethylarginine dimethylaminohydrolase 1-like isoform X2 n=1 Tax=Pristiophorus japonicus TaxID=55135 RepID=UPI00398E745E